jgi:hypothetical protein
MPSRAAAVYRRAAHIIAAHENRYRRGIGAADTMPA